MRVEHSSIAVLQYIGSDGGGGDVVMVAVSVTG